jgi:hypothetical protein
MITTALIVSTEAGGDVATDIMMIARSRVTETDIRARLAPGPTHTTCRSSTSRYCRSSHKTRYFDAQEDSMTRQLRFSHHIPLTKNHRDPNTTVYEEHGKAHRPRTHAALSVGGSTQSRFFWRVATSHITAAGARRPGMNALRSVCCVAIVLVCRDASAITCEYGTATTTTSANNPLHPYVSATNTLSYMQPAARAGETGSATNWESLCQVIMAGSEGRRQLHHQSRWS